MCNITINMYRVILSIVFQNMTPLIQSQYQNIPKQFSPRNVLLVLDYSVESLHSGLGLSSL